MKKALALILLLCLPAGCAAPQDTVTRQEPPPVEEQQESTQETPLSPVYTDWSKLEPYEAAEPLYTYHTAYGEPLQARDDYGALLPYVGTMANVSNYIVDKLPLYGLVTAKGEIVTEPVYAGIYWRESFLILYRGEVWGQHEEEWGTVLDGDFVQTVMAPDGSWMLEPGSCYELWEWRQGQLACPMQDGSVLVINSDGAIAAEFPRSAFTPYLGEDFQWSWEGGPNLTEDNGVLAVWHYREENADNDHSYVCFLDVENGTVSGQPPEGWAPFDYSTYVPDETQEPPEVENYGYLNTIVDSVTGKTYYYGYNRTTGEEDLLDESGQVVFPGCGLDELYVYQTFVQSGLVSTAENNCFCYADIETGETVFRYPVRSNSD